MISLSSIILSQWKLWSEFEFRIYHQRQDAPLKRIFYAIMFYGGSGGTPLWWPKLVFGNSNPVWATTNKVRVLCGSGFKTPGVTAMQPSPSFSFKEILSRKNSPRAVFDLGIDINTRDSAGQTLLIVATLQNNQTLVQALLDQPGIEINLPDHQGRTVLMYAISGAHQSILEQLLADERIVINQQDSQGISALMLAAAMGLQWVVKRLMQQADIEVNLRDNSGRTALMLAVLYSETDVVEELLRYSVDDTVQDKQGRTAFFFARHLRRPLLVETLLRHPSLPYDFLQSRLS